MMTGHLHNKFQAGIGLVLLSLPAFAGEIWTEPPFSASPQAMLAAGAAVSAPQGSDAVVLWDRRTYSFDEQGRCSRTIDRAYRVLTAAGAARWASSDSRWEPWREARPKLRARVITPDGAVHDLDPGTIAESPAGERDGVVYSDARVVRAPLPAVGVGAIVEEEIVSVETAPLPGSAVYRVYFGYGEPSEHSMLSIEAPAAWPLKYAVRLLPAMSVERLERDGRVRIAFTQVRMDALEAPEPYLPFDVPRWPHVIFSTGGSWTESARAYSKLMENQIRVDDVKDILPKALPKPSSPLELGNAVLAELHRRIRYTGVEFGEAAIVPRTPAETLKRQYGDCKDQATVLVAMLRAAGIPARLALLNAGTDQDVDPDMPGIGLFDHAIVYVPGTPEFWADPTDEFARFNELPVGDQNRFAMIVDDDGRLVKTPDAKPSENGFMETREFRLPDFGKADVVSTLETWGEVERGYRYSYRNADPKKLKSTLESYAKATYLTEATPKYEYSEPADLSKPFHLRLEMVKSGRGAASESDAAVSIPFWSLTNQLPEVFFAEDQPNKRRKGSLVLPVPYTGEWRYKILPAPGFKPGTVAESGTQKLGPAVLTKEFKAQPDGSVLATIRFDTVKRLYSADEVEALKADLRSLAKSPVPIVRFDQAGAALLNAGRIRDALDEFRRLAAAQPKSALHRTQIARALLAAGAAESARQEARLATGLDPASPVAFATLGWILQHDLVGRRFRKGSDLAGAEAAYRKSVELDPEDNDTRTNLAILLESEPDGIRYQSKEKLDLAIFEYKALEGKLKNGLERNILFALLFAKRFDELRELAVKQDANATTNALLLAAVAGSAGGAQAVAEARKRIDDDASRRAALLSAGQWMLKLRNYEQAADLMEAAVEGSSQAAEQRPRIDAIRKAKPYEEIVASNKTPTGPLYRVLQRIFSSRPGDQVPLQLFTSDSGLRKPELWKAIQTGMAPFRNQLVKAGLPVDVLIDMAFAVMQVKVEGDDAGGYRVRTELVSPNGSNRFTAYVIREEDIYRLVSLNDTESIGPVVLNCLERGDEKSARRWLDWAREQNTLAGGDDPLAGQAFPRIWTRGSNAGTETIRQAAASLMASGPDAAKAVDILKDACTKAASDADRMKFEVALATAYSTLEKPQDLLPIAQDMLRVYPDSDAAFGATLMALQRLKTWDDAERVIAERLARRPEDHAALSAAMGLASLRGDFPKAIGIGKQIAASAEATTVDLNNLAWDYLVAGSAPPEAIETAQKAVQMSKSQDFNVLHTLAALYAEAGKTAEARELMLQGMEVGGQDEPEGSSWYVFGRIAEQYDIRDAALADYQRLKKPSSEIGIESSTWTLAQRRIAALKAPTASPAATSAH